MSPVFRFSKTRPFKPLMTNITATTFCDTDCGQVVIKGSPAIWSSSSVCGRYAVDCTLLYSLIEYSVLRSCLKIPSIVLRRLLSNRPLLYVKPHIVETAWWQCLTLCHIIALLHLSLPSHPSIMFLYWTFIRHGGGTWCLNRAPSFISGMFHDENSHGLVADKVFMR